MKKRGQEEILEQISHIELVGVITLETVCLSLTREEEQNVFVWLNKYLLTLMHTGNGARALHVLFSPASVCLLASRIRLRLEEGGLGI